MGIIQNIKSIFYIRKYHGSGISNWRKA